MATFAVDYEAPTLPKVEYSIKTAGQWRLGSRLPHNTIASMCTGCIGTLNVHNKNYLELIFVVVGSLTVRAVKQQRKSKVFF